LFCENRGEESVNAMPFWMLIAFALASGFVLSGLVVSADRALFGDGPMRISFASPRQALRALAICAFAGPNRLMAGAFGAAMLPLRLASALLALFWSFCAGVLAMQACFALSLLLG
jgi:hypothetical protein